MSESSAGQPGAAKYTAASVESRMIRLSLASVAIAGIITTGVAGLLLGGKGVLAAALGALVVFCFFGFGMAVVIRVLRTNPAIAMNVALMAYLAQIVALFVLLILLKNATFFAPKAFAVSVLVCALVWTGVAVTVLMKSKVLYVEPGSGPGQPE